MLTTLKSCFSSLCSLALLLLLGPAAALANAPRGPVMLDELECQCKAETPIFTGKNGWTFDSYDPFLVNGCCSPLDPDSGLGCDPLEDFKCLFGGTAKFTDGSQTVTIIMAIDAPEAYYIDCGQRGHDDIDHPAEGVVGSVNTNCLSCSTNVPPGTCM